MLVSKQRIIWKPQQSNNSMHTSVAQRGAGVHRAPLFKSQSAQTNCDEPGCLYKTPTRKRDVCTVH